MRMCGRDGGPSEMKLPVLFCYLQTIKLLRGGTRVSVGMNCTPSCECLIVVCRGPYPNAVKTNRAPRHVKALLLRLRRSRQLATRWPTPIHSATSLIIRLGLRIKQEVLRASAACFFPPSATQTHCRQLHPERIRTVTTKEEQDSWRGQINETL